MADQKAKCSTLLNSRKEDMGRFHLLLKLFEMFLILDAFVKCRMGVWGSPQGDGL